MAEAIDLDEWELLSQNSFSREDFEEDDFVYEDYLSERSERQGEVFDLGKEIQSESHEILGTREISGCRGNLGSGENEVYHGELFDCGNNILRLERGFDEKDLKFDKERVIGESSVCGKLEMEDSIEDLGFGETEVLGAFCSNEINYEKTSFKITKDPLAFQGIDNLNLVCSNKIHGEIKGLEESFDSSNLAKDKKEGEMMNSNNLGTAENEENGGAKKQICKAQNENKDLIWWKMPMDLMKYYLFGIKPVWSVSLAMSFLGFLMISRKLYLYKMKKQQEKAIPPIKVHFDEKKRAQVQARAARLNKGLTVFRPEPIIRTPIPGFGVTTFPAMGSFQWGTR
ncbi:hypothetical protein LUZ60_015918 [Juncus effusus]|nr:hypothetical protein LUZ60_015918 [Juncus effusus]